MIGYYLDESNLVLLKKENKILYQYSFVKHLWYSLPEIRNLENTNLIHQISEQQAQTLIQKIDELIQKNKKTKTK